MSSPLDARAIKADLIRSYDAVATARDERGESAWRDEHRQAFADEMRANGKTRLLEIGAGSGHSAAFFVAEGFPVVAIDLSPANVARCRAKGLDARTGDFYALDFPDGSFDAVWAMSCLMHVPDADLPGVLAEMARVLVPDGIAMIGLWGGTGTSGIWEDDDQEPARFYSWRTDDQVEMLFGGTFEIERFETIANGPDDPDNMHYQLLKVRRP